MSCWLCSRLPLSMYKIRMYFWIWIFWIFFVLLICQSTFINSKNKHNHGFILFMVLLCQWAVCFVAVCPQRPGVPSQSERILQEWDHSLPGKILTTSCSLNPQTHKKGSIENTEPFITNWTGCKMREWKREDCVCECLSVCVYACIECVVPCICLMLRVVFFTEVNMAIGPSWQRDVCRQGKTQSSYKNNSPCTLCFYSTIWLYET